MVEMQSWIMQWGAEVEVLEPQHLRREIMLNAQRIVKKYETEEDCLRQETKAKQNRKQK